MAIKVLAIGGSLRKGSFNHMLLEQARRQAPEGLAIEIANISDIPLYNGDIEAIGFPDAVQRVAAQAEQSDAFLLATPEYNYAMSGVMKNVLDWLSRVPAKPFAGKTVALATAAGGLLGGARAQLQMRQVLTYLDVDFVNKPEVLIAKAHEKFSADGELIDLTARGLLDNLLLALQAKTLAKKSVELQSAAA